MIRLSFAKDVAAAMKNAQTVLVVTPAARFEKDALPRLFGAKIQRLLNDLATDAKPGDMGASASSLTGGTPRRVVAGVLPNRFSRYNSSARPEAIYKVVSSAGLARETRASIILVLDGEEQMIAALNAIGRAFPLYTAKTEDQKEPKETRIQILALDQNGKPIRVSSVAKETMAVAREVAALVDTPPTDMNPEALAEAAKALLGGLAHVEIEEIVGDQLLDQRLFGIHSVGRCAVKPPRMLVATYSPPKANGSRIALVGKGITFDTGGLHLKARGMMETMKSDMGGSAAVAGAFRVLAKTGSPHRISLVMCIAENAIGPVAYKPDDILKLHSGKTVEINNTDAEGRLLLADGVSYAARVLQADYIFDAATLTGAQLIATGTMHAAVMSNDPEIEALVVAAGYATGDLVHPLPFAPEFYRGEFKSPIADMRNSVKDRANAQTSCAGQFIYNHIDDVEGLKWCHVDLAGPAFRNDRGTGFGVALLSEAVRRLT